MNREILRGPMSQENVDLVRSGYKALAEGDVETVLSLLDPDITR